MNVSEIVKKLGDEVNRSRTAESLRNGAVEFGIFVGAAFSVTPDMLNSLQRITVGYSMSKLEFNQIVNNYVILPIMVFGLIDALSRASFDKGIIHFTRSIPDILNHAE